LNQRWGVLLKSAAPRTTKVISLAYETDRCTASL
jgi:hypothetical protein